MAAPFSRNFKRVREWSRFAAAAPAPSGVDEGHFHPYVPRCLSSEIGRAPASSAVVEPDRPDVGGIWPEARDPNAGVDRTHESGLGEERVVSRWGHKSI